MLPGFSGHLLSEFFLESHVHSGPIDHGGRMATNNDRRRFDEWRRRCRLLGPASAVRTILESAAVPLLRALGFDAVCGAEEIDAHAIGVAATMSFLDDFTMTGTPPPGTSRHYRIRIMR